MERGAETEAIGRTERERESKTESEREVYFRRTEEIEMKKKILRLFLFYILVFSLKKDIFESKEQHSIWRITSIKIQAKIGEADKKACFTHLITFWLLINSIHIFISNSHMNSMHLSRVSFEKSKKLHILT